MKSVGKVNCMIVDGRLFYDLKKTDIAESDIDIYISKIHAELKEMKTIILVDRHSDRVMMPTDLYDEMVQKGKFNEVPGNESKEYFAFKFAQKMNGVIISNEFNCEDGVAIPDVPVMTIMNIEGIVALGRVTCLDHEGNIHQLNHNNLKVKECSIVAHQNPEEQEILTRKDDNPSRGPSKKKETTKRRRPKCNTDEKSLQTGRMSKREYLSNIDRAIQAAKVHQMDSYVLYRFAQKIEAKIKSQPREMHKHLWHEGNYKDRNIRRALAQLKKALINGKDNPKSRQNPVTSINAGSESRLNHRFDPNDHRTYQQTNPARDSEFGQTFVKEVTVKGNRCPICKQKRTDFRKYAGKVWCIQCLQTFWYSSDVW